MDVSSAKPQPPEKPETRGVSQINQLGGIETFVVSSNSNDSKRDSRPSSDDSRPVIQNHLDPGIDCTETHFQTTPRSIDQELVGPSFDHDREAGQQHSHLESRIPHTGPFKTPHQPNITHLSQPRRNPPRSTSSRSASSSLSPKKRTLSDFITTETVNPRTDLSRLIQTQSDSSTNPSGSSAATSRSVSNPRITSKTTGPSSTYEDESRSQAYTATGIRALSQAASYSRSTSSVQRYHVSEDWLSEEDESERADGQYDNPRRPKQTHGTHPDDGFKHRRYVTEDPIGTSKRQIGSEVGKISPRKRYRVDDMIEMEDLTKEADDDNSPGDSVGEAAEGKEVHDEAKDQLEIRREKNRVKQRNLRARRANKIATMETTLAQLQSDLNSTREQLDRASNIIRIKEERYSNWIRGLENELVRLGKDQVIHELRRDLGVELGGSGQSTSQYRLFGRGGTSNGYQEDDYSSKRRRHNIDDDAYITSGDHEYLRDPDIPRSFESGIYPDKSISISRPAAFRSPRSNSDPTFPRPMIIPQANLTSFEISQREREKERSTHWRWEPALSSTTSIPDSRSSSVAQLQPQSHSQSQSQLRPYASSQNQQQMSPYSRESRLPLSPVDSRIEPTRSPRDSFPSTLLSDSRYSGSSNPHTSSRHHISDQLSRQEVFDTPLQSHSRIQMSQTLPTPSHQIPIRTPAPRSIIRPSLWNTSTDTSRNPHIPVSRPLSSSSNASTPANPDATTPSSRFNPTHTFNLERPPPATRNISFPPFIQSRTNISSSTSSPAQLGSSHIELDNPYQPRIPSSTSISPTTPNSGLTLPPIQFTSLSQDTSDNTKMKSPNIGQESNRRVLPPLHSSFDLPHIRPGISERFDSEQSRDVRERSGGLVVGQDSKSVRPGSI